MTFSQRAHNRGFAHALPSHTFDAIGSHGLMARMDAQAAVNHPQMSSERAEADAEVIGNFFLGAAAISEGFEDLLLALRKGPVALVHATKLMHFPRLHLVATQREIFRLPRTECPELSVHLDRLPWCVARGSVYLHHLGKLIEHRREVATRIGWRILLPHHKARLPHNDALIGRAFLHPAVREWTFHLFGAHDRMNQKQIRVRSPRPIRPFLEFPLEDLNRIVETVVGWMYRHSLTSLGFVFSGRSALNFVSSNFS